MTYKVATVSDSNSWLTFCDDLLWPRRRSDLSVESLRNLCCHQFLFNETSLIPDSWWITNPQLRFLLAETDLFQAIREGWLVPAIRRDAIDGGLYGLWKRQCSMSITERYSRLVVDEELGVFLRKVDKKAQIVDYKPAIIANFFSSIVSMLIMNDTVLREYGLLPLKSQLNDYVFNRISTNLPLTLDGFYRLAKNEHSRLNLMEMLRPAYLLSAPVNYGYHITISGSETSPVVRSVERMLSSLLRGTTVTETKASKLASVFLDLDANDPVFQSAGFLKAKEIGVARANHFPRLKKAVVAYCADSLGETGLSEALKTYQSNVKDELSRLNARFDILLTKLLRASATVLNVSKGPAGSAVTLAAKSATGDIKSAFMIGATISVLLHACQIILDSTALSTAERALTKGRFRLLTRLDIWRGETLKARGKM